MNNDLSKDIINEKIMVKKHFFWQLQALPKIKILFQEKWALDFNLKDKIFMKY